MAGFLVVGATFLVANSSANIKDVKSNSSYFGSR
jgi:hypothetical protein